VHRPADKEGKIPRVKLESNSDTLCIGGDFSVRRYCNAKNDGSRTFTLVFAESTE
jgi:hypothetical protein